jgi:chromosome segregation ATPase
MSNFRLNEALAKIHDALDEQTTEIKLLQRNLKDLQFELSDVQASLTFYDDTLGDLSRRLHGLASEHRKTAALAA